MLQKLRIVRALQNSESFLIGTLGILNLLFVSSYSSFAVHALFFFKGNQALVLRESIIFGMAIFAATQVGGVWLLSLFGESTSKSRSLLWGARLSAAMLLSIPKQFTILLGFTLFGLSHAIYYVRSRELIAKIVKRNKSLQSKAYTVFGITTNLSFLGLPILGSYILNHTETLYFNVALSMSIGLLGLFLLLLVENAFALTSTINTELKSPSIELKNENTVSQKQYLIDILRFLGFILPYSVLMALIPIKASEAGWSSATNSYLISANGAIVALFQIIFFWSGKKQFDLKTYDRISVLAFVIFMISLFSTIEWVVPLFLIWCFCEAYQLPSIEYHLFSERAYSGKKLNRILAFDAAGCFMGPFIAEHLAKPYIQILYRTVGKLGGFSD